MPVLLWIIFYVIVKNNVVLDKGSLTSQARTVI